MSYTEARPPECTERALHRSIDLEIQPRQKDVGGFSVARSLPTARRRMVGPFIFWDHMGPGHFAPGEGLGVRPHPHINLATVTWLFDGEILHRDSVGNEQIIRPGSLNWMVAGRGITHSERATEHTRQHGGTLHGIQAWVALPEEHEETEPSFHHHPADELPLIEEDRARIRLIAGAAFDVRSPVRTHSRLFYAEVILEAGGHIEVPDDYTERAAYLVEGEVGCDDDGFPAPRMLVFGSGPVRLTARTPTRLMLLGGEPLGQRHIWWNFVSSRPERIEQAKADWKADRFPSVVGDDDERVPLPE